MKSSAQYDKRIDIQLPSTPVKINKMACLFFIIGMLFAAIIVHGFIL